MVIASGNALRQGTPRAPNTFQLCLGKDEDVTQLGISISGQGRPEIWTETHRDGTVAVSYRITLVGSYKVYVTYEGRDIPGSPFELNIR